MIFTHNNKEYTVTWIRKSKVVPNVYMVGAMISLGFKTLGIPGDILFAKRIDGNRLQIIDKWGVGPIYERHALHQVQQELARLG